MTKSISRRTLLTGIALAAPAVMAEFTYLDPVAPSFWRAAGHPQR